MTGICIVFILSMKGDMIEMRAMSKAIWQKRTTAHKITQEFNIERRYVLNSRCSRSARYFIVK